MMKPASLAVSLLACALASACGGDDAAPLPVPATTAPATTTAATCSDAAAGVTAASLNGVSSLRITSVQMVEATATAPLHCHVLGTMNERVSTVDGFSYAIKFRLRMPVAWNGRFFMEGGGGSNGTIPTAFGALGGNQSATALAQGFAVVATDSGHDNAINVDPNAGGVSAYGRDPQARYDFGYNAYDLTTQVGKAIVARYYGRRPDKSYFVACSEGGREAATVAERFPTYYDGVVAGDPAIRLPVSAAYAPYLLQTFALLAVAQGNIDANGVPLINKTYTDADLQLFSKAVVDACDALDGLADGISNNVAACTPALVAAKLAAITCVGTKNASCLSTGQISAMQKAMAGPITSDGKQLYPGNPWDPGIGGMNGTVFNGAFRSYWLGSYASPVNDAIKVSLSTPQHTMVWRTPPVPLTAAQYIPFELTFNIDTTLALINATDATYKQSVASWGLADSSDLSAFQKNGGKMLIYHGHADTSLSVNDSIAWWNAINTTAGGAAAGFVRLYTIPGMNHCTGGPSTDQFDVLGPLVNWVERGVAPDTITATASNPGYFGVAKRTRPLCPYPTWAHYNGSGDINDAANFSCKPG